MRGLCLVLAVGLISICSSVSAVAQKFEQRQQAAQSPVVDATAEVAAILADVDRERDACLKRCSEISKRLDRMASQIDQIESRVGEVEKRPICRCGDRVEELMRRIESLEQRQANRVIAPKSAGPVISQSPPPIQATKQTRTVTMHSFSGGRRCAYCKRWLAVEAPKLTARGIRVEVARDAVNGPVPRFEVCGRSGCRNLTGYQSAETILSLIGR